MKIRPNFQMIEAPSSGLSKTMNISDDDKLEALPDEQLDELTAKIRPLPDNVVPSERFMEQMRRRLLALRDTSKRSPKQAA